MSVGVFRRPPRLAPRKPFIWTAGAAPTDTSLASRIQRNRVFRPVAYLPRPVPFVGTAAPAVAASLVSSRFKRLLQQPRHLLRPATDWVGTAAPVVDASLLFKRAPRILTPDQVIVPKRKLWIGTGRTVVPSLVVPHFLVRRHRAAVEDYHHPIREYHRRVKVWYRGRWIGTFMVAVTAAYTVEPYDVYYLMPINRVGIGFSKIEGDVVDPEYMVGGDKVFWLSNRAKLAFKKVTQ